MRELMSVNQPCLFCEQDVMASVLHRDDETGKEYWSHEPIPHDCARMQQVRRERVSSNYAKTRTDRPEGTAF